MFNQNEEIILHKIKTQTIARLLEDFANSETPDLPDWQKRYAWNLAQELNSKIAESDAYEANAKNWKVAN
jgi:hypothetical protein